MLYKINQSGDDPELARELVSFTAIHWRVAKRHGVGPAGLTRSYLARLLADDEIALEAEAALRRLPVAPRSHVDDASARAQRFFRSCIETGSAPTSL